MATATLDAVKQIHYLAAALKAPRITEAAQRLADQARDAGWTHEDYLAAVLEREVSARNASGAQNVWKTSGTIRSETHRQHLQTRGGAITARTQGPSSRRSLSVPRVRWQFLPWSG